MRILIANEALGGGGGVETYLAGVTGALAARGHAIGVLHLNTSAECGPTRIAPPETWSASVADQGLARAFARAMEWAPDVAFSHNMRSLEVEARVASSWPTVKMMHGYFGTCVSGQKARGNGMPVPCDRALGAGCLVQYLPRRCGPRRPFVMMRQYRWATRQRELFASYRAMVVASEHMRREYVRHGMPQDRVYAIPLFASDVTAPRGDAVPSDVSDVLFMGRMTRLKGAAMLVEAASMAQARIGRRLRVVMAGSGPDRAALERLAAARGVDAVFPGWVAGEARARLYAGARLVAMPSRWPEPFGLVGLEAGSHGVPAVAFDVGGVSQWLRDGVNGRLVPLGAGADGLATAISDVLSDDRLRLDLSAGARSVAAELSAERHVARLERVLEDASPESR